MINQLLIFKFLISLFNFIISFKQLVVKMYNFISIKNIEGFKAIAQVNIKFILNFLFLISYEEFMDFGINFIILCYKLIGIILFSIYIILNILIVNFFKIFLYCNFYGVSLILPLLVCIAYLTLVERKVIGASQRRLGPEVTGLFGLGQPIADVLNYLQKKQFYLVNRIKLFL